MSDPRYDLHSQIQESDDGTGVDLGAAAGGTPEQAHEQAPGTTAAADHDAEARHEDSSSDVESPGPERPEDEGVADLSAASPGAEVEPTGNPVVDSVLDSMAELDRLPPDEHVAVFEAAHERLRSALADAGEPPADS